MATSKEYTIFLKRSKQLDPNETIDNLRTQYDLQLKEYTVDEVRFEPFSIGDLAAFWSFAPDVNRRRILLFFIGEGFCIGTIEAYKSIIGRLSATTNAAVCAIQYRQAPEHPFPAALDDALTAYRYLLHHPYARSRIVFGGISSGANLALALLLRLKQEKIALPAGAICLSPWIDLSKKQPDALFSFFAEKYSGQQNRADPLISPLHGDFTDLPPIFLQSGGADPFHDETLQLAKAIENITLDVWPGLTHNFQLFAPAFPEAMEALERAGEFMEGVFTHKHSEGGH